MPSRTRRRVRSVLVAIAVVAAVVAVAVATPIGALLQAALEWIAAAGPLGFAAFAGLYLVGTLIMLPASTLSGSAGLLYGPIWGLITTVGLSVLWSSVTFLLGRTLLRRHVQRRIARWTVFEAIDEAIERRGLTLVILLRISPVMPFNVVSYALGVTRVRFRDYVLGTAIGAVLPMALYTTLGASVGDVAALLAGDGLAVGWVQVAGLVLTVVATALVTRFARRALREALERRELAPASMS